MPRILPVVSVTLLLAGCSRSGHHPDPIAPVQAKSEYDIWAKSIRVYKDSADAHTYRRALPPQRTLSLADSTSAIVYYSIQNVGSATLPIGSIRHSITINGKPFVPDGHDNFQPKPPGGSASGGYPVKNSNVTGRKWGRKFNKPGRYEVRLQAWLDERFGETNLDDNVLVHYVDVEE